MNFPPLQSRLASIQQPNLLNQSYPDKERIQSSSHNNSTHSADHPTGNGVNRGKLIYYISLPKAKERKVITSTRESFANKNDEGDFQEDIDNIVNRYTPSEQPVDPSDHRLVLR